MRVTLNKVNVLTFNKNTYEKLGRPPAVYLYYSRKRDVIALEPVTSTRLPEAFPVLDKNLSGYRINVAPFCRHLGISLKTSVRFINPEMRNGKLELKLTDTVSVAQPRKRRTK